MDTIKKTMNKSVFFLQEYYDKNPTHKVTNISIDPISSIVSVTIEKGSRVDVIKMTINNAIALKFLNLESLKIYCK